MNLDDFIQSQPTIKLILNKPFDFKNIERQFEIKKAMFLTALAIYNSKKYPTH